MADRPVANLRDLPAFGGVLLALTALALPWSRQRECPIFGDCGSWETLSGWETVGTPALVGLALAMLCAVALRDPSARRIVPALLCALLGLFVIVSEAISFEVFVETQGPLAGAFAFGAGIALAVVGWLASALTVPRRRREASS